MDSLVAHVDLIRNSIDETEDEAYFADYLEAQLSISMGDYAAAHKLLIDSYTDMQSFKDTYVWKDLYYSVTGLLATVLDYIGQIDEAEKKYDEVMILNPTGMYIGDYAIFLHRRKRQFDEANSFYLKAMELYPDHSSIQLKYAGYLRHIKKDLIGAEDYYRKSCLSNPNNSDALGSFASFLHGVIGNMTEAVVFYEKSIEVDNTHANNLCNYGLFLSEEQKNYEKAESLYK